MLALILALIRQKLSPKLRNRLVFGRVTDVNSAVNCGDSAVTRERELRRVKTCISSGPTDAEVDAGLPHAVH